MGQRRYGLFCSRCGSPSQEGTYYCQQCGAPLPVGSQAPQPYTTGGWQAPWQETVIYAGFWRRCVASLIDSLVLGVLGAAAGFILAIPLVAVIAASSSSSSSSSSVESLTGCTEIVGYVASLVIGWLYYALMESSAGQATLGKKALGIVVTDMDGKRISFGRASGRFFGKIISGLTLGLGYIMAGFTEKKQALHDMLAGCLVVCK